MRDENTYWKRKSLSRRSVMRGAGVAGVGLTTAALVGCGGGDDDDSGPAAAAPTQNISGTAVPTAVSALQPKKGGQYTQGFF